ncbi:hypothetical protein ETB55_21915 [Salmonella enterica subsp. enterica serovar Omuna]|nr:hypothetical protein [Salmonella enterica subsp. enterica serovar Omuna]
MGIGNDSIEFINKLNRIDAKLKIVQRTIVSPDNSVFADELSYLLDEAIEQLSELRVGQGGSA